MWDFFKGHLYGGHFFPTQADYELHEQHQGVKHNHIYFRHRGKKKQNTHVPTRLVTIPVMTSL